MAVVTGQAWSHPHAAVEALLTDAFCQTTYGASAWATIGTPTVGPADSAAASKIYLGGYTWTTDAADEGIEQTLAGQAAGQDYVVRVIAHNAQANDIRVEVYDNTNNAVIVQFDFGAASTRTAPGVALFTFELPTIARNGAGSDCVSIDFRVVSTAAGQVITCHQCELLQNLIDNPSLETGAGNPWIPDGWVNVDLDAGDSQASSTGGGIIHSGSDALQYNAGASSSEYVNINLTVVDGQFYAVGGWGYGVGDLSIRIADPNQASNAAFWFLYAGAGSAWEHATGIARADGTSMWIRLYGPSCYADDVYSLALPAVSITATPADADNSTEGTGLRVDGNDLCTQPAGGASGASNGTYRARFTPRHDLADIGDWGNANGVLMHHQEDANNYIMVREEAGVVRLAFNAQGAGLQQDTWAGPWNAADQFFVEIIRKPTGAILKVNGAIVITIVAPCVFATAFTQPVNWGTTPLPWNQFDGTLARP